MATKKRIIPNVEKEDRINLNPNYGSTGFSYFFRSILEIMKNKDLQKNNKYKKNPCWSRD